MKINFGENEVKVASAPKALMAYEGKEIVIKTPRKSIIPRGKNQKSYVNKILDFEINFGIGPAGTGKTFLAVAIALTMLLEKKN